LDYYCKAGVSLKYYAIAFSIALIAAAVLLAPQSHAAYVSIMQPFNYTATQNSTVYLGKDGPGQTFYVTISASTANASGAIQQLGWNKLVVSGLPQGWIAQNSSLYNPTLSAKITPSPNAQNGTYSFNITAVNIGNYSGLGSVRIKANINITPNVFKLVVSPSSISQDAGQQGNISVSINNTGVSDSLFAISISGLPAKNITSTVIALHGTKKTFKYPIIVNEPGVYGLTISVRSTSSPLLVYKNANITLTARATIANDYAAIGNGIDAFPITYEPLYAIMYLIERIFGH
jgi:hypothetical protein